MQGPAQATGTYQPKFAGDPARSDSEATALGYMRVVLRAEHTYKKRHGKYTTSLAALAGTGTFTKRMAHDDGPRRLHCRIPASQGTKQR